MPNFARLIPILGLVCILYLGLTPSPTNAQAHAASGHLGFRVASFVDNELGEVKHVFILLKSMPKNANTPNYTPEMAASDNVLAKIFGGPNTIAAAHGFEPAGLARNYPLYRGDLVENDGLVLRGHLSDAMHLYGNAHGTGDSPLYVPAGFVSHGDQPSPTDGVVTFYYPRLGVLSDVTLAVFHIADFQITHEGDRVRIGNIGGRGGSSPTYRHSHVEFYRGNCGLPPLSRRALLRISATAVFGVK